MSVCARSLLCLFCFFFKFRAYLRKRVERRKPEQEANDGLAMGDAGVHARKSVCRQGSKHTQHAVAVGKAAAAEEVDVSKKKKEEWEVLRSIIFEGAAAEEENMRKRSAARRVAVGKAAVAKAAAADKAAAAAARL